MHLTRYDARTAGRAAGALVVVLAIAWVLTATTDEGGLRWADRATRVLPLVPVCAGLAAWLALLQPRGRGELRALAALGRSPSQSAAPAACGAAAVALACALAILVVPRLDVRGFFPAGPQAPEYVWTGDAFVDVAGPRRIEADGEMTDLSEGIDAGTGAGAGAARGSNGRAPDARAPRAEAGKNAPEGARGAAALTLLMAGLAFPLVGARLGATGNASREALWTLLGVLATLAASAVLFAAAAAGKVAAPSVALPSIVLLVAAVFRYRADSWQAMAE